LGERVRRPPPRDAEALEAAAELAAVCDTMKDGDGFGMLRDGGGRCFFHSGGGENRRSSQPKLGTGEQEEHATASWAGTAAASR
jgi:hypothetical protein